jgi:hypothetical protein
MDILQTEKKMNIEELNKYEVLIGKILCVGSILE